jgi:ABC-type transporter Mla MlaB component
MKEVDHKKECNDPKFVRFSGAFTFAAAEEILHTLRAAISDSARLCLDLSAVSEIDLAGLQLICAAHRSAHEVGASLEISTPLPDHIVTLIHQSGFPRQSSCLPDCNSFCMWNAPADANQESLYE